MLATIQLFLRWSARISGLLLFGLVAVIVIGHGGLPNVLEQPVRVQLEFLAMGLSVAGFLVGCRSDGWGALLTLGGFGLFCAVEMVINHRLPGQAIPYFTIPGILYLLSYWASKRGSKFRRFEGTSPIVPSN